MYRFHNFTYKWPVAQVFFQLPWLCPVNSVVEIIYAFYKRNTSAKQQKPFDISLNSFAAQATFLQIGRQVRRPNAVADLGFSPGGAPTPKVGVLIYYFAENCMKMKEFGPPGGGASLAPPLDPPMKWDV